MIVKKSNIIKYCLIIIVGIIGILLIKNKQTPTYNILVMWITTIIAVLIVKCDIFHPYTWFGTLFSLYSTGYAIIYAMGYKNTLGYSNLNLLYSYVALITVLLIVGPKKIDINGEMKKKVSTNEDKLKTILNILSILTMIFTVLLMMRGYSGKSEMKKASDSFYRIGVYFVRYNAMFVALFTCFVIKKSGKKNMIPIILSVVSAVLFSLYTGERDAMFRTIAIVLLILFSFNILKKKHLIFVVPAFILFMISSVILKYYFISGEINDNFLSYNNIVYMFLSSDFSAAGSNLQKLINTSWTEGYKGYSLIFTEMVSAFVPSSMVFNPDHWFNYEVYSGMFHGHAFTLVGTGYIMGGLCGIIVLFILIGLLIKYLYNKANSSIYMISVYFYMITTIIFSFRQSLSTITVSLFRVALLSVIICKILPNISIKKKNNL